MKSRTLRIIVIVVTVAALCVGGWFVITLRTGTDIEPQGTAWYEGSNLRVKTSSWSGWSKDYKPEEQTHYYSVEVGDTITFYPPEGQLSFTVTSIDRSKIVIKTDSPMALDEGGHANLGDTHTKFEIPGGETIILVTPTLDFGYMYYITYQPTQY